MYEHSVRVPRHYKIAANILKKVSTQGGSVKTLLYDDKLRHFRTNVLYALITEAIKHSADIDKMFESTLLLAKEPRLDPWLAKILCVELLFGKKSLPGQSKPEQTIQSYREQFEKYTADNPDEIKKEASRRPRYVRINTNLLTTSDAIRAFQDEGYRFVRCTSGSYNDYLEQIKALEQYDFTQDFHVKSLFVFSPGTKLHDHELYLESKIILQDKATTLPVHLLAPPPGSKVLDMCAAPGMKTMHLAAYMKNEGKVYAVERKEPRFKTLCDFVEKTGSTCVETINKDVLEIRKGEYDDVEYILLDPSCSGSGMELCVHNYIEDTRLAKLTSLQEKLLKHATNAFPNVKRIVYSTCSMFPEENERVVTNVVNNSRHKWRVQNVKELLKDQWNNFGSGLYGSIGVRCLYARPDTDLTTGFFLAVIDRDSKDQLKQKEYDEKKKLFDNVENVSDAVSEVLESPKKKRSKKYVDAESFVKDGNTGKILENNRELDLNEENTESQPEVKKKKKKNKTSEITHEPNVMDEENISTWQEDAGSNNGNDNEVSVTKKKKKKKQSIETNIDANTPKEEVNINLIVDEDEAHKKKKKKRKSGLEVDNPEMNSENKKKKEAIIE